MRILVCVKQVPDPTALIQINESALWVTGDQSTQRQMNRFDEYAVEQALILKEQVPETSVHVVTAGPERSAAVVRRALGMGADHGIHVLTDDEGYGVTVHRERGNASESRGGRLPYVSASLTASRIAATVREGNYDLILAGVMSEDMCQGLVGPMLAEMLSMPCATSCISVRVEPQRSSVYVEREIEGGRRQLLELDLPALLTVQSGMNKPRYPSLSNMMRAGKQELEIVPGAAGDSLQPQEALLRLAYPRKTRAGVFLEGSRKDKARQLLNILRERSLLTVHPL